MVSAKDSATPGFFEKTQVSVVSRAQPLLGYTGRQARYIICTGHVHFVVMESSEILYNGFVQGLGREG